MDDFSPAELINEQAVLFVCATAGQGEEPENMKQFWKFLLRKNLPADSLAGLHFAVLSLGDSSFPKFNWVGKRLNKRLLQLGGSEVIGIGLCDDQHDLGIAGVYVPFVRDFFDRLVDLMPSGTSSDGQVRNFKWNVEVCSGKKASSEEIFERQGHITKLSVLENSRTTAESHFQDVRLIQLERGNLNWEPGDVACIRPQNSDEVVEKLFTVLSDLGLSPQTVVEIKEFDSGKLLFI